MLNATRVHFNQLMFVQFAQCAYTVKVPPWRLLSDEPKSSKLCLLVGKEGRKHSFRKKQSIGLFDSVLDCLDFVHLGKTRPRGHSSPVDHLESVRT